MLDRDDAGFATGGMTASLSEIEAIAQNALGPFYTAIHQFVEFAGWSPAPVEEFGESLSAVFPDIFGSGHA